MGAGLLLLALAVYIWWLRREARELGIIKDIEPEVDEFTTWLDEVDPKDFDKRTDA